MCNACNIKKKCKECAVYEQTKTIVQEYFEEKYKEVEDYHNGGLYYGSKKNKIPELNSFG